jgi:hypothetical protein
VKNGFGPKDLFEHTVIEFHTDGEVRFADGGKIRGSKGDKFKLFCIRGATTLQVKRVGFSRALSLEERKQKIAIKRMEVR